MLKINNEEFASINSMTRPAVYFSEYEVVTPEGGRAVKIGSINWEPVTIYSAGDLSPAVFLQQNPGSTIKFVNDDFEVELTDCWLMAENELVFDGTFRVYYKHAMIQNYG